MDLKDCRVGTLVNSRQISEDDTKRFGHIIGFSYNSIGQAVVIVRWAIPSDEILRFNPELKQAVPFAVEQEIHHSNLIEFTEDEFSFFQHNRKIPVRA